jgi:hypothetical protein
MTDIEARLGALRADPSREFAAALRSRLETREGVAGPARSWRATLAVAAAAVMMASLLAIPDVRASAAAFLAHFRVVNFVAVPVDGNRFGALGTSQLDVERLIGDQVVVLEDSVPTDVSSIDDASARAGFDVRVPAWLPDDSRVVEVAVTGERAMRVTGDSARLRGVLDALGLTDVKVPAGLDGETATIRVPPVVMVRYEHGTRHTRLFQSRAPEVALSSSMDLAALGEIGLRVLGLSPDDARHFSQAIDWTSTMVVPIPPTARAFRQVDIAGSSGLWVGYQPAGESDTNMVIWSRDGRVYGLASIQATPEVLAMANSVP